MVFKKGNVPWNKGMKGIHLNPKYEFKKGHHINKGIKRSEEQKKVMKKISLERFKDKRNHPLFGFKFSEESRKKMSETRKRLCEEGKIIPWNKGKEHSAIKGNKNPAKRLEVRQKIKDYRKYQVLPRKDTKIEIKIQNFLRKDHINFFKHYYISEITNSYQCDIFIPVQKNRERFISQPIIIECDGCYWHGCPICNLNKRKDITKIKILEDIRKEQLERKGFKIIRLWEHEIEKMEINNFNRRLQIKDGI